MEIRFALCLFLFHPISCFGVSAPFEHMWSRSSFVFIALQSYSYHLHQFSLGQNRLYIINVALTTTGLNHHSFIALGLWEMLNYSTCWVYTDSSRFCICIWFSPQMETHLIISLLHHLLLIAPKWVKNSRSVLLL